MSSTPNELPATADVVIVGAGLMGASSAWQLAQRGVETLVLEQYEPATSHGSSHGSARIVRRAYPHDDYVTLTGEAFELWHELERQSNTTLIRTLGGIDHGTGRGPLATQVLDRAGISYDLMAPAEAENRHPGMRFDGPVLYQADAGTLDSEGAVAALLQVAQQQGTQLRTGVSVTGVEPGDDVVVVHTDHGDVRAGTVVVAAGAWCEGLIGGLVPLPPLAVSEHRVFHFPRVDSGR